MEDKSLNCRSVRKGYNVPTRSGRWTWKIQTMVILVNWSINPAITRQNTVTMIAMLVYCRPASKTPAYIEPTLRWVHHVCWRNNSLRGVPSAQLIYLSWAAKLKWHVSGTDFAWGRAGAPLWWANPFWRIIREKLDQPDRSDIHWADRRRQPWLIFFLWFIFGLHIGVSPRLWSWFLFYFTPRSYSSTCQKTFKN